VDKIAHLANSTDRASNTVCGEPYSTSEQLFQLLQVSGKGHGLVVSQGIKRGTCIIEETPIGQVRYAGSRITNKTAVCSIKKPSGRILMRAIRT